MIIHNNNNITIFLWGDDIGILNSLYQLRSNDISITCFNNSIKFNSALCLIVWWMCYNLCWHSIVTIVKKLFLIVRAVRLWNTQ